MNPVKVFARTLFSKSELAVNEVSNIYDIKINTLLGKPIDLSRYKGKHLLFVNVASKCGFTPQYKALQQLHENNNAKIQIIGVPCNQFGKQEPENANKIQEFCKRNYGVSFLITEKIEVKGKNAHPLYQWLTQKRKNGVRDSSVKWNFQKYLINKEGALVDYYFSTTSPISPKITRHLK